MVPLVSSACQTPRDGGVGGGLGGGARECNRPGGASQLHRDRETLCCLPQPHGYSPSYPRSCVHCACPLPAPWTPPASPPPPRPRPPPLAVRRLKKEQGCRCCRSLIKPWIFRTTALTDCWRGWTRGMPPALHRPLTFYPQPCPACECVGA